MGRYPVLTTDLCTRVYTHTMKLKRRQFRVKVKGCTLATM